MVGRAWCVKQCCYAADGDLTGTLNVIEFQLSSLLCQSSLAIARIRMVWHFGTSIPKLTVTGVKCNHLPVCHCQVN